MLFATLSSGFGRILRLLRACLLGLLRILLCTPLRLLLGLGLLRLLRLGLALCLLGRAPLRILLLLLRLFVRAVMMVRTALAAALAACLLGRFIVLVVVFHVKIPLEYQSMPPAMAISEMAMRTLAL